MFPPMNNSQIKLPNCHTPVFFVGQASTGKTTTINLFHSSFPDVKIHSELARTLMKKHNLRKSDLEVEPVFYSFQMLLIDAWRSIVPKLTDFTLIDRSPIDTLFYLRIINRKDPELEREMFDLMRNSIVIHFPFRSELIVDDGERILGKDEYENVFLDLLHSSGCSFHSLTSLSVRDRMLEMIEYLDRT